MAKKKPLIRVNEPGVDVHQLLQEGLKIIQGEFVKIREARFEELLPPKAQTSVNDSIRCLLIFTKEARFASMEEDLAAIDQTEFDQLAKQAALYLSKPHRGSDPE